MIHSRRPGLVLVGIAAIATLGAVAPASAGQSERVRKPVMTLHEREIERRRNHSAERRQEFAAKHIGMYGSKTKPTRSNFGSRHVPRHIVRPHSESSPSDPYGHIR
jgi:hypothetical protein